MAVLLLNIAVLLQIGDGAFDRTFGDAEIGSNSLDPRPALALGS